MPWKERPVAAVLPASTEEVQEIVKVCNCHGLKYKAFSTGWGAWAGATRDNVVIIDLRRMNRILDIDEKNMYAVVEPYVCSAQLQAEAMKLGLNTHIIGCGPVSSPLASATSGWGVGQDGIYMSYSPRNILGLEWVQPTGEVLRLGTLGSGKGWFCGDGPGPSLRGIMRGNVGTLGGMGVFTKVALKLFHWPGPPQVKSVGTVSDLKSEVPEQISVYMIFLPDKKRWNDACYDIGNAEIGYNFVRMGAPTIFTGLTPHLWKKIRATKNISRLLDQTMRFYGFIVLAGTSERNLRYQENVLRAIVTNHDGFAIDFRKLPTVMSNFMMNLIRVSFNPLIFRLGGSFSTALARNDSLDAQSDWCETICDVKDYYIKRDEIIDDMAVNPYYVAYENNTWAHCEVMYQFDPRNEKHLNALPGVTMDFVISAIESCMEPGFGVFPAARKVLSPLISNYNEWQKKLSAAFDPNEACDKGYYTDEAEFDFSKIAPERRAKLEKLVSERKWTEMGPPE
jgi:glycolate oxidase